MTDNHDFPDIAEGTLYPPKRVAQLDGCCVAEVYNRLTRGEYQAFKDHRKTLIPGASILERRRKFLKPAVYAPRNPNPTIGGLCQAKREQHATKTSK